MTPEATPSLARRLLCVLYDGLLLSAVLLVATFPFLALTQALPPPLARALLQGYLVLVSGTYFTVFWHKGQTLAMKTWGMRLETQDGKPPTWAQAWLRLVFACGNVLCLGLGWWSAALRSDRQFLQDRLAGTRLVKTR